MIRVLIVDDHPVVRAGLKDMLSGEPDIEVVGEAGDGSEALSMVERLGPDVALMDLRMPGMDGVEAIARISKEHPGTHVLVLTTYDSDADILRAIEAGATGYLLKDTPREELYGAVRATAGGGPCSRPPSPTG
nr:response regulator transcription factor [Rubrobacter tropicus]